MKQRADDWKGEHLIRNVKRSPFEGRGYALAGAKALKARIEAKARKAPKKMARQ